MAVRYSFPLVAAMIVGLAAREPAAQDRTRASDGPRVVRSFAELRPATDLERRRATLLDNPNGIRLERISKESFFVARPHKGGNARFWADDIFPLTEEEKLRIVLRDQVCEADVVLLAHAISEHPYLNKSETGFITDVVLAAERWIRPVGTVASPTKLTASFRGGGARIREQDIGDEGPNPILGEAYVFFLKFLKEAETFTGGGVHSIQGRVDEYPALNTPLDEYLKRLDEAAAGCPRGGSR